MQEFPNGLNMVVSFTETKKLPDTPWRVFLLRLQYNTFHGRHVYNSETNIGTLLEEERVLKVMFVDEM